MLEDRLAADASDNGRQRRKQPTAGAVPAGQRVRLDPSAPTGACTVLGRSGRSLAACGRLPLIVA